MRYDEIIDRYRYKNININKQLENSKPQQANKEKKQQFVNGVFEFIEIYLVGGGNMLGTVKVTEQQGVVKRKGGIEIIGPFDTEFGEGSHGIDRK